MKDFEHKAAYVMGVALPLLEVARRRTDSTISGYVDDFIAGGLYNSFFGQLASTRSADVSGLPSAVVVGVKGVLYCVALHAPYRSVRRPADR